MVVEAIESNKPTR